MEDWRAQVDALLKREKEIRQADEINAFESEQVLCNIISLYKDHGEWVTLRDMIGQLAKRRRQPKQGIIGMVKLAMSYLDELPPEDELVNTLKAVTEGKIFLEVEFARITRRKAAIKESQGNIEEASNLMQEVQVETYGSMEKDEKLEFLLEQMRLLLKQNDYIRFQIYSNKVSRKVMEEEAFAKQKCLFLDYMVKYYDHEKNYFEVARSYEAIYETILKWKMSTSPQPALEQMLTYLLLVEYHAEQINLLRLMREKENHNQPLKVVINILLSDEIGRIPAEMQQQLSEEKWKTLCRRINQHNIRIVQKYYSRITLVRLSQLLDLTVEATEEEVRDMVSYQGFRMKINRPEGFVYFSKGTENTQVLNQWGDNIFSLLNRFEEISHLIEREKSIEAS